jgi:uncharacterized protein YjbJ (UPF0337 family)
VSGLCQKGVIFKGDCVSDHRSEAHKFDKVSNLKFYNMNRTIFKGNWDEIKGKLKQKYANLTDDDLMFVEGKEDETLGRIEKKLGKSRNEVERILRGL